MFEWIYTKDALPKYTAPCYIAVRGDFNNNVVLDGCIYDGVKWRDKDGMGLPLRWCIYAWMYQQSKPAAPEYR